MATMKEWDELLQYHSKANWNAAYNNKRNGKHEDMNTNGDVDNWTTQHINDCVALHYVHIPKQFHSACARSVSLLVHISSHSHWLKFEPCPHFTHGHPHAIHVCDLFTLNATLYFPAFLLSVFLFPFFHFSDEQQPELKKKIMENLRHSAANGGEDTYDVLYLPTDSWDNRAK